CEAALKVEREAGAHAGGGLLRDQEIERAAAAFGEGGLVSRADLQPPEGRDPGVGREGQPGLVAGLDLAEELIGAGLAVGDGRGQARHRYHALLTVAGI